MPTALDSRFISFSCAINLLQDSLNICCIMSTLQVTHVREIMIGAFKVHVYYVNRYF